MTLCLQQLPDKITTDIVHTFDCGASFAVETRDAADRIASGIWRTDASAGMMLRLLLFVSCYSILRHCILPDIRGMHRSFVTAAHRIPHGNVTSRKKGHCRVSRLMRLSCCSENSGIRRHPAAVAAASSSRPGSPACRQAGEVKLMRS